MVLTLLFAGAAVAVTFLCVMTVRLGSPALAGDQTVVGLGNPTHETLPHPLAFEPASRADWQLATVTNLRDAEDMLDCLENQGVAERELVILGNSCFAVRWR
jgi:hypothetical protein